MRLFGQMLSKSAFAKTFAAFQNFYSFFQTNLQHITQSQLLFILMMTIQSTPHHYPIVEHYLLNMMLFHDYPTYSRTFHICTFATSSVRTFHRYHIHSASDLIDSYRRVDVYSLLYRFHRYNVIICLPKHSAIKYVRDCASALEASV